MRTQSRSLDLVLVLVALFGPAMHLLGLTMRGLTALYADTTRLGVIYVLLALSVAAGSYLVLRQGSATLRALAGVGVALALGSMIWASSTWSGNLERILEETTLTPFEGGQIGILVAPADSSPAALQEGRALAAMVQGIISDNDLSGQIVVRRAYPVSTEEQVLRMGERFRANIVLWRAENLGDATLREPRVTALGAAETDFELEPLRLMMLMATQDTFGLPVADGGEAGRAAQLDQKVVAPVAAGFSFLAVGRPVSAAAQFQNALRASTEGGSSVPTSTVRSLHDYLGTAFLFANRPDLAKVEYELALASEPHAYAWVGLGNVHLARRDWHAAADAYNKALSLDPYNAASYCGRGITLAREREVRRTVAVYRQASALQPNWGAPYALLGLAHELEANIDASRKAYQTCAVKAGPNVAMQQAALRRAEEVVRHPPTAVPTATPLPTLVPTPIPTGSMYSVKRGDTLRGIADKFGVTPERLMELNEISNPNILSVGQILIIPQKP